MKPGTYFRIPQGRADLELIWEAAQPLDAAHLPAWVWPEYASTYRYVAAVSGAGLAGAERQRFDAELKEAQGSGLIIAEDEHQAGTHHVYVTAPKLPFFVDDKHHLAIGAEALSRVASQSDVRFLQGPSGVIEVDQSRWKQAQDYERRSWMDPEGLRAREDRNSSHEKDFHHYATLQGRRFDSALEIGCGPFTNILRILKQAQCRRLTLLDPLINDYLTHPHCAYAGSRIPGRPEIQVRTVASPVEDFATDETFDLVVMINVLEHCFSVPKVFARILALTAPGGVFVFHDKYLPAAETEQLVRTSYDAGHPLRVAGELIEQFLARNYDELFCRQVPIPTEVCTFDSTYFIGSKRPA